MSLHYRLRGIIWHIGGTVKVGRTSRKVPEHSTGCVEREAAESYGAKLRREIELELVHGTPALRRDVQFDDAAMIYLDHHGHLSDVTRVATLRQWFGGRLLHEIDADDWQRFCREILPGRAPATWERHAITLRGIFSSGGVPKLKLPRHGKGREIVASLPQATARRLLDAYAPLVRPIAALACYSGLRAQEALQLEWRDLDLVSGWVRVRNSKNGDDRRAPIPPRARKALSELKRRADRDKVFLNPDGCPWPDTRHKGGNPMRYWHDQACARAGVTGFRWHDWRHHWATACVQAGVDIRTLMRWGGWRQIEMVTKYAAPDDEQAAKLERLG